MREANIIRRRKFLTLCGLAPIGSIVPSNTGYKNKIKARRVVTGLNADNKSKIIKDDEIPDEWSSIEPKIVLNTLWQEDKLPVDFTVNEEQLKDYKFRLVPNEGVIAHLITCQPGFFADWHATDTIDLIFIISGKIELQLEMEKTIVYPGDTVIQRGTNHAWKVIGNEPCTFAAVLFQAKENNSASKPARQ